MSLTRWGIAAVIFTVLLAPSVSRSQGVTPPTAAQSTGGEPPPIFKTVARGVATVFTHPLHAILAGVAPGGGFGVGLGVDLSPDSSWTLSAKSVVTLQHAWLAETNVWYERGPLQIGTFARVRDMPQLDFYGIGIGSARADRTTFAARESVGGGVLSVHVAPWLTLGGRVEENWVTIGPGRSSRFESIETKFAPGDVPGMADHARYGRYEGSIAVRIPAAMGEFFYQGARYRIALARYDDQRGDQFSFSRLDIEAQQRFALPFPRHRLTLHAWLSTDASRDGQDTPFYLQRTLGGKSFIRSVHDDIIGSDGSDATLRAFGALRFRDRSLLLLQAEYRVPIWGLFEGTAYVDAGTVAPTRSDLDLNKLKRNVGLSVAAMREARSVARIDLAFGGGEGYRLFFTVGRDLTR